MVASEPKDVNVDDHSQDGNKRQPAGAHPAPSPSVASAPMPAGARPTVGDTVIILKTANTKEHFQECIGKEYVITTDRHNEQPYQVETRTEWLYEEDVRLTKKKVLADDEKW